MPSLLISTEFKKDVTSISFPKLYNKDFNSSLDNMPSLFRSAALNYSLSFVTYSLVSFLSKWPAEAAEMNSWKSSFPSLFESTLLRKELMSISFPRLSKSTFNSSCDRKPSLLTSAILNYSFSFAT